MNKSRLDKFLASALSLGKRDVKVLLAQKKVHVDDNVINDVLIKSINFHRSR